MDESARLGKKTLLPFIAYLVFFYAAWTGLWVYWIYPWAERALGNASLSYALVNFAVRGAIWIAPVFLYLIFVDRASPLTYLKLRRFWKRGIAIGLALSALNFLGTLARLGAPDLQEARLTWNGILGTSILIGLFEEIPFRGFILQKFGERMNFWAANALTSLIFVGAHLPGWISLHALSLSGAAHIFVFSLVMGLIFRHAKSLWAPIIAHSLNDGISHLLFR